MRSARAASPRGARLPQWGARLLRWGAGLHPRGEPGSTPAGSPAPPRGAGEPGSPSGSPGGTWAPATWPDWLCRICSPQPPYEPSKAHFRPPVAGVREVNKSGTADTALKTRLPPIYSGAPPLRSPARRGAGQNFWVSRADRPRRDRRFGSRFITCTASTTESLDNASPSIGPTTQGVSRDGRRGVHGQRRAFSAA